MRSHASPLRRAYFAWLRFWFPAPAPDALLALLRIGTALILLYVLFLRSFDLETVLSQTIWNQPGLRDTLDPIGWPFSVFRWVESAWWLWSMHALALLVAGALLAGVLTPLMAFLSVLFQLSYAHYNPVMQVGVDGLLVVALAYLSLAPSGRVLGVFARREPEPGQHPPFLLRPLDEVASDEAAVPWSALAVRGLQLHLSVLYVHSALSKLTTDWLAGAPLWHPRLLALGELLPLDVLQSVPWFTSVVTYGLVLFELLYGILIWVPVLRYPLLILALLVHLSVGVVWGLVPFNLLMIVLNLAFVPPAHLDALVRFLRPLLVLPWVANDVRE